MINKYLYYYALLFYDFILLLYYYHYIIYTIISINIKETNLNVTCIPLCVLPHYHITPKFCGIIIMPNAEINSNLPITPFLSLEHIKSLW